MSYLLKLKMAHSLKMIHKILILNSLLIYITPSVYSITKSDSIKKVIKTSKTNGDRYFRQHDVYKAIENYEQYTRLKGKDAKRTYRLANLYFETRNYVNARKYYDTTLNLKAKRYPKALYYKGIMCMNLGDYTSASESFTTFKKKFKNRRDKENLRKLASIYIESCEWAKAQKDTNAKITVSHLNNQINKVNIDFSPTPVDAQTIYYGSVLYDSATGLQNRQLFEARKLNGNWQSTGLLKGMINIPGTNTGNAAISPDGQTMYFTRSRKNWKGQTINEIYVSYFDESQWQEPEKLPYPINDENSTNTQPSVGRNLKTGADILYFVSDRLNGKGGLDIWSSETDKSTGLFKEPRNLDKNINSPGNECCPYYDASTRTLYFSSDARNGLGGYDIYKSLGTQKKWTVAEHLPMPLNTKYDDYYFSTFKNGVEGFLTSNRPGSLSMDNGSCCDDIFYYKIFECAKVHAVGKVLNYANYDFFDKLNNKYHLGLTYPENNVPLADVPVELYIIEKESKSEILLQQSKTNTAGEYEFDLERNKNYKVLVKNYGYFDKKIDLSAMDTDCGDTVNAGITHVSYMPKINIRINIYYEHNKYRLTEEARQAIDTTVVPIFDLFPNAVIEIGSHTDSTGTDEYNLELSQQRSESVVKYLTESGIAPERLVAKGYGESTPIAPNSKPDGSDNPEGRQLNRRTEMRIVGEVNTFYLDE